MTNNRLTRKIVRYFAGKVGVMIHNVNRKVARETLPRFANNPKNLTIDLPRRIINPERIFIGDNVSLGPGSFLNALTHYPTVSMCYQTRDEPPQTFQSEIIIGDNVTATADLQIAAQDQIVIEDDVMFASNVHINDGLHGYNNANEPYRCQKITGISPILIKTGSWIGQNVVILPGVTIGKFAIIGANSVVNKSIPDRCIAVGSPAEIIKKWNEAEQKWTSMTR
jgi:acetyltransferase-like isoleucine patch superfamily enzyme